MSKYVGGQAVIEGVLMRAKDNVAIAIRKKKTIKVKKERFKSLSKKYKFLKWPFLRGILNLYEMLVLGTKALIWSANEAEEEDEKISSTEVTLAVLFATLFTILLFIALPLFLTKLMVKSHGVFFNLIDGLLRIIIFIIYLIVISRISDIKRVFQYHGAEHMAVNCYEHNKEVTVKNCRKYNTLHMRCGTSFLIIVLIISILIFSLIKSPNWFAKLFSRILLIPVVVGISYELLKLFDKFKDNIIIKVVALPGLWIQKLTTREPDNKQLEVAIMALKTALK